jgi:predicted DNA-binding ribbon-helix-helix protein
MKPSLVVKHSVAIDGQRTSVSLEEGFWTSLTEIAHERGENLTDLITSISANRQFANLSSALRVFVLEYYRDQDERRISLVPNA